MGERNLNLPYYFSKNKKGTKSMRRKKKKRGNITQTIKRVYPLCIKSKTKVKYKITYFDLQKLHMYNGNLLKFKKNLFNLDTER
ncbi:hypothetical protein LguiA_015792 [Lonicera macranthoides]